MQSGLKSLSKIFAETIFRIPDYQRGYAWTQKQLKEFWADIEQLPDNKSHYTGVLTLEPVAMENYSSWEDDLYKYTRKIQGGKLIHPDWSILYEGNQTIEQTEGYPSKQGVKDTISADNVFKFTGKTNGTNRKGLKYTSEITVPIIKKESCKYIQSGIYQITPDSLPSRIVNFGDGTCDSKATVTINGKVYDFELK